MTKGIPKELLIKVRKKTLVEIVGTECMETVIRELYRGKNISQIVIILNKKYSNYDFTYDKIRAFIQKNSEIANLVKKIDWKLAKKHAELHIDYQEKLYNVLDMAEKRLKTMKEEGCTDTDFFRGIKTLVGVVYAHRKILGGPIGAPTKITNINITQKISNEMQDLRTKVLQAKIIVPETPLIESQDENQTNQIKDNNKDSQKD